MRPIYRKNISEIGDIDWATLVVSYVQCLIYTSPYYQKILEKSFQKLREICFQKVELYKGQRLLHPTVCVHIWCSSENFSLQNEFPFIEMSSLDSEFHSASNGLILMDGNSFLYNSFFRGASSMVLASHRYQIIIHISLYHWIILV
jgi:hypothetical protein